MLTGGQLAMGAGGAQACSEAGGVTFEAAADLAVQGYTRLGAAVTVKGAGPFPHGIDVTLPFEAGKVPASRTWAVVVLLKKGQAPAHAAPVANLFVDHARGKVRFHVPDVATFQVAVRSDLVAKRTRRVTFRAIAGPSMGGFGSSHLFWHHPDRYDMVGVMGPEPGPDLGYSTAFMRDFVLGGFCSAEDGVDKIGQACPVRRKPLADQMEISMTFEALHGDKGEGTGLSLDRNLYMKGNRDFARALGNLAFYNPESPYLPPGVPASTLSQPNADLCANPVRLKKFFDRSYNPQGKFDVITFCEGADAPGEKGKLDPSTPGTVPTQILLAVDVNGNGRRDPGEPVLSQAQEPFRDVGADGVASDKEPGYDPVANPDPAGDDYHYLWNPGGTENNWRHDEGEPYEDVGVDGVAAAVGGCPAQKGVAECYDYGEGNGKFDQVPSLDNWMAYDARQLADRLDQAALDRLDLYHDAGIRDFFNSHVSTNSLTGALLLRGVPVRIYDGYPSLVDLPLSRELSFEIKKVDYGMLGRHMYVRYGDPDLAQAAVEATGDGRHAGSAIQVVHRIQTLFSWISERWPDGDRAIATVDSSRAVIEGSLMTQEGRAYPYSVVVPPGYWSPENATKRYPVVYLSHAYGMDAIGLAKVSFIAQNAMVDESVDEKKRMQKFFIVSFDGRCSPEGELKRGGPLPQTGDLCESGTFFTDHPEGTYKGDSFLLQLQAKIDAEYRTRAAQDFPDE